MGASTRPTREATWQPCFSSGASDRTVPISLHSRWQDAGWQDAGWQDAGVLCPDPCVLTLQHGALAQLGERLNRIQQVIGSIPIGSTSQAAGRRMAGGRTGPVP